MFSNFPKLHTFIMVFHCIIKLTMSLKILLLTVLPKRYYCHIIVKAVFFREILKWYYFLSYCFQCSLFTIVFDVFLNWCLSVKTLFLTVIPKRYYCQKLCFSKKYSNGSTFKSNVFKVIFSKSFFKVILHWQCLSKQCFWQ